MILYSFLGLTERRKELGSDDARQSLAVHQALVDKMTAYLTELLISPVIGLPRSVVPFAAKSPASQPAHLLSNTVEPVKKYARVGRYRRRWEAQLPRRTKNSAVGDDEREGSKDRATASKMNMASSVRPRLRTSGL